jgi:GTP-binding protein
VPVGTIVRKQDNGEVIADLEDVGSKFVAARGGAGGKGNTFFATDTKQAPEIAEVGADGDAYKLILEIRSMAHIGLVCMYAVGLPFIYLWSFVEIKIGK